MVTMEEMEKGILLSGFKFNEGGYIPSFILL